MGKAISFTIVFKANSLNYGEGVGNVSELKKFIVEMAMSIHLRLGKVCATTLSGLATSCLSGIWTPLIKQRERFNLKIKQRLRTQWKWTYLAI